MTEETIIKAAYCGSGCFVRDDNTLAFVCKQRRPSWLRIGCIYRLEWLADKEQYRVVDEVEA